MGFELGRQDPAAGGAPQAFSLADRAKTTGILSEAGFGSVAFAEVHKPVLYGPDVNVAQEAVVGLLLGKAAATDEVLERLRALVEVHLTADGAFFDSRAWIVTAGRRVPALDRASLRQCIAARHLTTAVL